mmetsp:Transcript_20378/g.46052  ORF Transcript_20378/g.46052 Transcript_20378/m.46052 type:complete len:154 (-) Transcript_20378:256-717(-)
MSIESQTRYDALFGTLCGTLLFGAWIRAKRNASLVRVVPKPPGDNKMVLEVPKPSSVIQRKDRNRMIDPCELAQHKSRYDAWISVDGTVYNITPHLANHPGWSNAGISTPLAIMNALGRECGEEFREIMSHHTPQVAAELRAYRIGVLSTKPQ